MAVITANDLVTLSLRNAGIVGVGQTPRAQDINDAFDVMNMMLAQWQRKRWLVWQLVTTSLTSTGAQFYTVGLGGDFNIARPDKIESAYQRQLNLASPVDYPLEQIFSHEDYDRIRLKGLTSFAQFFFYDSAYPMGKVYPWPVMQAASYALHITTKVALNQFTNLAQNIDFPPEYKAAIFYNLMVRLRAHYRLPVDQAMVALAKDALQVIRTANTQIPTLRMPVELTGRASYDVYSDLSR